MTQHATQEWQHSLMDCSPCDSCLLSTCLPGILFGRTTQRLMNPTAEIDNMNGDCMVFCGVHLFTGCGWILNMIKRREIREKYGIPGGGCSDCCTSFWCLCCALIQQDKEVKSRIQQQYGADTRGYQPMQEGMHMPNQQQNHPKGPPPQY